MKVAFPPLDHRNSAPPQTVPARRFSGKEARTAGPMPGTYQPEKDPLSFSHNLSDTAQPASAASEAPSFGDFLDMINPLQHIPVVNLIYRSLTGDEIGGAAQIVGGAIYGGPIGAIAGTANAIVQHETGQSVGEAAITALSGETLPSANRQYVDIHAPVAKRYNFNQSA